MKYNFVDDAGALLAKYANEPPSVELHVHPTHYRFSNQEGIIPRNHPSIQAFLKSVEEGVILPAATEVFRDSGTRFYEGCIIIAIVDYTTKTNTEEDTKPQSYRILLKPTDLTLWHDLLYTTDASQGRFSDQLALSMESEILNLTVRSLDLRVPSQQVQLAQLLDGEVAKQQHLEPEHRVSNPKRPVRLHEDAPVQSGSALEDFLLLRTTENQPNNSNQFMRLGFIEQLKKRRRPAPVPGVNGPQQAAAAIPNEPLNSNPQTPRVPNPQQIQQLQQQQQLHTPGQQQQQPHVPQQMSMPQGIPQMSPQMQGRPQTPSAAGVQQQQQQQQQPMMQGQMSSPMMRARQLQRARMNGMTPAHAQVQQQAHAHAMRNANANAANMRNMQNMNMQNMSPQVRQQIAQQQAQQAQAQQAQQAQMQGRQMPQNMPQGMMYNRQNMQTPQQQRMMQNQMPYSPNLR